MADADNSISADRHPTTTIDMPIEVETIMNNFVTLDFRLRQFSCNARVERAAIRHGHIVPTIMATQPLLSKYWHRVSVKYIVCDCYNFIIPLGCRRGSGKAWCRGKW